MKIIVCPLHDVEALIRLRQPTHVLSLLSPKADTACFKAFDGQHLELRFHDISAPTQGLTEPNQDHIHLILDFARSVAPDDTILIHCWAGVSRSTAAAYIIRCAQTAVGDEAMLAHNLRAKAPYATPNPALIAIADAILGRNNAMTHAIEAIGRGTETAWGSPFCI